MRGIKGRSCLEEKNKKNKRLSQYFYLKRFPRFSLFTIVFKTGFVLTSNKQIRILYLELIDFHFILFPQHEKRSLVVFEGFCLLRNRFLHFEMIFVKNTLKIVKMIK